MSPLSASPRLTDSDIEVIGHASRDEFDQILGNCFHIGECLQEHARDTYGVELGLREVQVGEARETHFVNTLDTSAYAESDMEGYVLIDAALDQFCQTNWNSGETRVCFGQREWIPEVAIYPPGAEERYLWYYRANDPEEGRDVFTGELMDD